MLSASDGELSVRSKGLAVVVRVAKDVAGDWFRLSAPDGHKVVGR